ncbi:nucleoside hydrolase [Aeoliella mucimassa]|uniref:Ribonucleoside hydrolase RihC n=1 Tax=Aeoliella mucimassa TaxID=2527972 RepID=A0A518AKB9_9BACT|nr:nucleoside hydrolase [Aeoliella mucimassa]QDU55180.1 ribonucleoside hydrolase RihC [Aeoliella mucimassa]
MAAAHASLRTLLFVCLLAAAPAAMADSPVKVIFDTDIAGDVDDVGALAALHVLADRGEAEILACGISSNNPWAPACVDSINTWFGRPDIPIGRVGEFVTDKPIDSRYARAVAEEFPHDLPASYRVPTAEQVYRRVLAAQEDGSVTIVTVGFLTNLAALLDTPADDLSPLTGAELVKAKVKQWVVMGGVFPEGHFANGSGEYNLKVTPDATQQVINHWPTPVVFSGFEIGEVVHTGAKLADIDPASPVRRGYELYNKLTNRNSWDQTAVLYAVRGASDYWTLSPPGVCSVPDNSQGCHDWREDPAGTHRYLIEKMPPEQVAAEIESLMITPPAKK